MRKLIILILLALLLLACKSQKSTSTSTIAELDSAKVDTMSVNYSKVTFTSAWMQAWYDGIKAEIRADLAIMPDGSKYINPIIDLTADKAVTNNIRDETEKVDSSAFMKEMVAVKSDRKEDSKSSEQSVAITKPPNCTLFVGVAILSILLIAYGYIKRNR